MYPLNSTQVKSLLKTGGQVPAVPEDAHYRNFMTRDHRIGTVTGMNLTIKKGQTILLAYLKTSYVLTVAGETHVLDMKAGDELACD